jgi:hypothetical protein
LKEPVLYGLLVEDQESSLLSRGTIESTERLLLLEAGNASSKPQKPFDFYHLFTLTLWKMYKSSCSFANYLQGRAASKTNNHDSSNLFKDPINAALSQR